MEGAKDGVHALLDRYDASGSDLLYVTDRAPSKTTGGGLSYGAERARFLSFGSLTVSAGVESGHAAGGATSLDKDVFHVGDVKEIGRFPEIPYPTVLTAGGVRRDADTVAAHETAAAALKAEVARRLAHAKRKEIMIFVHGYNNSFDDAALSTGKICRSLDSEFVCILLTWPAGGSRGALLGYNVDRESGEFAVADLKKAIRIIAEAPGSERIHLLAHSRGTDVLVSVLQQLGIEAYVSRSSLSRRYKVSNIVLFAPDIDFDVAAAKIFGLASDPDLTYGASARPLGVFPQGALHMTIYSSPNDRALGISSRLFGSVIRLGQFSVDQTPQDRDRAAMMAPLSQIQGLVEFIEFDGRTSFVGHDYFLSNPAVSTDLALLLRQRAKAGDPARPLVEVSRPFWRIVEKAQVSR